MRGGISMALWTGASSRLFLIRMCRVVRSRCRTTQRAVGERVHEGHFGLPIQSDENLAIARFHDARVAAIKHRSAHAGKFDVRRLKCLFDSRVHAACSPEKEFRQKEVRSVAEQQGRETFVGGASYLHESWKV